MIVRKLLGRTVPCAVLAFACATSSVHAADATGYVGKGTLVVQTAIGGDSKLTVGGDIAFEESDPYVRIDLLSLAIPGADPTLSALMGTQLFPPGGFTIVYDRKASTFVVWSSAKREYYAPPAKSSAVTATPAPAPSPSEAPSGPNALGVFGYLRSLKDDSAFSLSIAMTGHGKTNGHPSTGIHFQYLTTTTSGDSTDYHGEMQLADDLGEIPIVISVSGKGKGLPQSALKLEATSIAQATPAQSEFAVPPGYTRATSLGDVIGKVLPQ